MGAGSTVTVRVLVADQHPIIRAGIGALLATAESWHRYEVTAAETTEEAIAMMASEEYTVVLMEHGLPGRGGVKATEMISSRWPSTGVIALMDSDDGRIAERLLKAGAKGCILRNVGLDTLVTAIRTVLAGRCFLSNEIAQQLLGRKSAPLSDPLASLTAREKQVFLSILAGQGVREIALQMGVAKRTIDKHRQHINYKLGTKTPLELMQAGLRLGLVSLPD